MKILQVVNAYYPPYGSGGAAFVAHNISKALAKRGHEVTVFTTNALDGNRLFRPSENPSYNAGVEIYYFGNVVYETSHHIYFSRGLVSAVKKNIVEYDIVHLHEYRSYISLVTNHYAKKRNVKYVLQPHGQLPKIMAKQRLKWIYDILFGYRLLRDASKVVALTSMEAEQCKRMGVSEEKIAIIPNGIDLSEYADLPTRGAFRKKFGIDEDEKIVLYLGRIHRIKGLDILAKAFANIVQKLDDVRLVIAGPDDGYIGELEGLTKALNIENNVLMSGPLHGAEKLEAYVGADVCVLPSRYETFPIGLLEAYASGRPVVASSAGGLRELVIDGVTGLLVKPEAVKHLAYATLWMLDNTNMARKMSVEGRRLVEVFFSMEQVADELERLYYRELESPLF